MLDAANTRATPAAVMQLQRTIGNKATKQYLQRGREKGGNKASSSGSTGGTPAPLPDGYTLQTLSGTSGRVQAYVDTGGFELDSIALDHAVSAANEMGNLHQTKKGALPSGANGYLHPSKKDPTLYAVSLPGKHSDGIAMIQVVKIGSVSGGVHRF